MSDRNRDRIQTDADAAAIFDTVASAADSAEERLPATTLGWSRREAAELKAVVKMSMGEFSELTADDMKDLFAFLDFNCSGTLELGEVEALLCEVLRPPCTEVEIEVLYRILDKNSTSGVEPEELQQAFMEGPFRNLLQQLREEQGYEAPVTHEDAPISRQIFVDKVNWRLDRDDAFKTLPFSLVFMSVFVLIVITHLKVFERSENQRAMELWVSGYGDQYEGPYHPEHVADWTQKWEWLVSSGLKSVLIYCQNDTATNMPYCPLAATSALVGDMRLRQVRRDSSGSGELEWSEWLLHSDVAEKHLALHPGDYLGAAISKSKQLWDSGWVDADTNRFALIFSTFNARSQMFLVTEAWVEIDDEGFVVPDVVSRAALIEPYPEVMPLILAIIYCLMLFYPILSELQEILGHVRRRGCRVGCGDYWGLWNAVDWFGITMGLLNLGNWFTIIGAMAVEPVQNLLVDGPDDGKRILRPDVMSLPGTEILEIEQMLRSIVQQFQFLSLTMGLNIMSIMLKFFKAFGANPRLQVVTNTLIRATEDLAHFFIVFLAIFIGFALTGMILFGDDLVAFRSFSSSVDTSFRALLGDFDWYSDETISDKELGSGMPRIVMALWFFLFNTFVVLILLNMLLAIIMEHYSQQVNEVKNASDANPLWVQAKRYVHRLRTQRKFIPLTDILGKLEDPKAPAHPEEVVTKASLLAAFPKIKWAQENFLLLWLQDLANREAAEGMDDENTELTKRLTMQVQSISDQLRTIKLQSGLMSDRLQSVELGLTDSMEKLAEVEDFVTFSEEKVAETAMKRPAEAPMLRAQPEIAEALQEVRTMTRRLEPILKLSNQRAAVGQPPPRKYA